MLLYHLPCRKDRQEFSMSERFSCRDAVLEELPYYYVGYSISLPGSRQTGEGGRTVQGKVGSQAPSRPP